MKISKSLQIVMFSIIGLGLQSSGHAQASLVNLYDWMNETMYSSTPDFNVQIQSPNSVGFFGSRSTNNAPYPFALPVLTGSLNTTPGTTYEISFTMQNDFVETIGQPEVSFGSFTTNFDLPAAQETDGQLQYFPVNIDLTAVAMSFDTTMTFTVPIDTGDAMSLNNLEVTAITGSTIGNVFVPEPSTTKLVFCFGFAWLLAQRLGRLLKIRSRLNNVQTFRPNPRS
jgi:hypothetical protein